MGAFHRLWALIAGGTDLGTSVESFHRKMSHKGLNIGSADLPYGVDLPSPPLAFHLLWRILWNILALILDAIIENILDMILI